MRLLSWALSDVGQKRQHNEDNYLVDEDLGLYAVADGMGGHAGGKKASTLAVEEFHRVVQESHPEDLGRNDQAVSALLRRAAQQAGQLVYHTAKQNPELHGMGTTLTALLFFDGRVCMAHVGDSRAYLFRDGRVSQLSEDHSWVHEQVKAGLISQEEANTSKLRHIITRSVGFEQDVKVDTLCVPVLMGDCFLLCTDGLTNYVDAEELGRIMTAHYYSNLPRVLVDLANERGGDDNITVVVIYAANAP